MTFYCGGTKGAGNAGEKSVTAKCAKERKETLKKEMLKQETLKNDK